MCSGPVPVKSLNWFFARTCLTALLDGVTGTRKNSGSEVSLLTMLAIADSDATSVGIPVQG